MAIVRSKETKDKWLRCCWSLGSPSTASTCESILRPGSNPAPTLNFSSSSSPSPAEAAARIAVVFLHACGPGPLLFSPLVPSPTQQEDRNAGNRLLSVERGPSVRGAFSCVRDSDSLCRRLLPLPQQPPLGGRECFGCQPRIPLTPLWLSPFLLHRKCCLGRAQAKTGSVHRLKPHCC